MIYAALRKTASPDLRISPDDANFYPIASGGRCVYYESVTRYQAHLVNNGRNHYVERPGREVAVEWRCGGVMARRKSCAPCGGYPSQDGRSTTANVTCHQDTRPAWIIAGDAVGQLDAVVGLAGGKTPYQGGAALRAHPASAMLRNREGADPLLEIGPPLDLG